MGRRDAAGIRQHRIGGLNPVLPQQELGVAHRFLRSRPRDFDRQCQPFACQFHAAIAFMGSGHQRQDGGIAGSLPKGRTQVDDRFARPVFLDQPAGAHLQGFDIGGILGQHLFDPRACADTVAVVSSIFASMTLIFRV